MPTLHIQSITQSSAVSTNSFGSSSGTVRPSGSRSKACSISLKSTSNNSPSEVRKRTGHSGSVFDSAIIPPDGGGGLPHFLQLAFVPIQMLRVIFHLTFWPERTRLAFVGTIQHDSGPHLPACFAADCP